MGSRLSDLDFTLDLVAGSFCICSFYRELPVGPVWSVAALRTQSHQVSITSDGACLWPPLCDLEDLWWVSHLDYYLRSSGDTRL